MASSYDLMMQGLIEKYRANGQPWPATLRQIGLWVLAQRLWSPRSVDALKQLIALLGRGMRSEFVTDPQGRTVRAKHAIRVERHGEQLVLCDDISSAAMWHMERSLQQRRQRIVAACRQLKTDIDSYNANFNRGAAIQLILNFTHDVEEAEILRTTYPGSEAFDKDRIAASIRHRQN